jgi:hypothetical protein
MFGYDFLLDDSGGVWLLEVNSSPSMDKSNSILESLIAEMSKDYINTLLACRSGLKPQVGTEYGKFKLIYVSPKTPMS